MDTKTLKMDFSMDIEILKNHKSFEELSQLFKKHFKEEQEIERFFFIFFHYMTGNENFIIKLDDIVDLTGYGCICSFLIDAIQQNVDYLYTNETFFLDVYALREICSLSKTRQIHKFYAKMEKLMISTLKEKMKNYEEEIQIRDEHIKALEKQLGGVFQEYGVYKD